MDSASLAHARRPWSVFSLPPRRRPVNAFIYGGADGSWRGGHRAGRKPQQSGVVQLVGQEWLSPVHWTIREPDEPNGESATRQETDAKLAGTALVLRSELLRAKRPAVGLGVGPVAGPVAALGDEDLLEAFGTWVADEVDLEEGRPPSGSGGFWWTRCRPADREKQSLQRPGPLLTVVGPEGEPMSFVFRGANWLAIATPTVSPNSKATKVVVMMTFCSSWITEPCV